MISITTANIRFENPGDGPNDWPLRKDFLAEILNSQKLDLLGTQEGRSGQLYDLESLLDGLSLSQENREWITERMYPCIFFNPKTVTVLDSGDIWLSKSPYEKGSKSFNSAFPRLCTYIKAELNGNSFYYVNCHLDHVEEATRIQQMRVLCEEITKINKEKLPLILSGDFNTSPSGPVREKLLSLLPHMIDPWVRAGKAEETSFHKFDGKDPSGEATRIDWIMHSQEFECQKIDLIKDHRNGQYPSDHFFVHAKLDFRADS